jgi:hypothetical protein
MTAEEVRRLIHSRPGVLIDRADLMVGDVILGIGIVTRITADNYWIIEPFEDTVVSRRSDHSNGEWYIAPGPQRIESMCRELVELL